MFKRFYFQEVTKRLSEPKKFIQVIIGPRQVGKTTLIRQVLDETDIPSIYITADGVPASDSFWLAQQWQNARLQLASVGTAELILVIDEIQKISNWSEVIKTQWDADKLAGVNIKCVLLGSSRLLIQKGLTESLAGRFESIYMGHWSYSEMQNAFGFKPEQFVWFGGYPGASHLITDEERWKNYIIHSLIETTLSKDIFLMEQINKPVLLRNLFELGCVFSGQVLSFNKILGQFQDAGNTTTLSNYLRLLDGAGLLTGLEKYSGGKIVQRSSSPKFQVQNTALFSVLSGLNFNEANSQSEVWGRHVESAIGAHLTASSKAGDFALTYWRDGNFEVDFILEKGNKKVAIEVKTGKSRFTAGMNRFKSLYNPCQLYLVAENGISWEEFLKINPVDLF